MTSATKPAWTRRLTDTVVVWQRTSRDRYGRPVLEDGEEYLCRWEWESRLIQNPTGEPVQIEASIILQNPLPLGAIVWKGTLVDLAGSTPTSDLFRVAGVRSVPRVNGRGACVQALLTRYHDSMPTVR